VQRIVGIAGLGMIRPRIRPAHDLQPRFVDGSQQFGARAQAQVLGDIRKYQPAFASRIEVRGEPGENPRNIRLSGCKWCVQRRSRLPDLGGLQTTSCA
jgi:hypothetical protein